MTRVGRARRPRRTLARAGAGRAGAGVHPGRLAGADCRDRLGGAARPRPAPAVAGPAVHRPRQLHRGGRRSALPRRCRPHRRVRAGQRAARARARSRARADDAPRCGAGRSSASRRCCPGRFRRSSRRCSGASCSTRRPGVVDRRAPLRRSGRAVVRLVRAPARRVGADRRRRTSGRRRRLSRSCCSPACRPSTPRSRRGGADRRRRPVAAVRHDHAAARSRPRSSSPPRFACSMRCGCSISSTS